ncbi:MAG: TraV family lipoprotein [Anaerolineae bacterium]|nr:TraV family lipoprotein [Anaerolineae bacterium]
MNLRKFALIMLCFASTGCSFMFPYENEFACPRKNHMGKCVSSMAAYEEATTGVSQGPWAKAASERDKESSEDETEKNSETPPGPGPIDGYSAYVSENYRQQAKLLEQPVTPILKTPDVLEILILSHPSEDSRTLWGNRYVHIIVEESSFVMGDYLKKKMIPVEDLF